MRNLHLEKGEGRREREEGRRERERGRENAREEGLNDLHQGEYSTPLPANS